MISTPLWIKDGTRFRDSGDQAVWAPVFAPCFRIRSMLKPLVIWIRNLPGLMRSSSHEWRKTDPMARLRQKWEIRVRLCAVWYCNILHIIALNHVGECMCTYMHNYVHILWLWLMTIHIYNFIYYIYMYVYVFVWLYILYITLYMHRNIHMRLYIYIPFDQRNLNTPWFVRVCNFEEYLHTPVWYVCKASMCCIVVTCSYHMLHMTMGNFKSYVYTQRPRDTARVAFNIQCKM